MLGNLNQQSITEILNGPGLREVRNAIRQGQAHEYCSNCVNSEKIGGNSERAWHNNLNPNFDFATAGEEFHHTVLVDVRWNTTCNQSCNYCDPSASSKWADLKGIPVKSGTRPYYSDVCDFIETHYDKIQEVAMVGGEPLLLPENERLLEVIPPTALITIITNLNVDLATNKIFKKLKERPRVGWSISFDNTKDRYHYVRYGGNWELLNNNLQQIKQLMANGHHGGIHAVYNIYNATRLCELKQFATEQGLTILWQNLFWPEYLNPFNHTQEVQDLAVAEIMRLYDTGLATESDKNYFDRVLDNYQHRSPTDSTRIANQFKQHIHAIETEYHPASQGQFQQLWPELHGVFFND